LWIPERKNSFKKQFKKLTPDLQTKTKDAISELCDSEDPAKLGEYKKHMKVYAYEIGSNYRIIYDVDYEQHSISFIRVGDHKSVYGTG